MLLFVLSLQALSPLTIGATVRSRHNCTRVEIKLAVSQYGNELRSSDGLNRMMTLAILALENRGLHSTNTGRVNECYGDCSTVRRVRNAMTISEVPGPHLWELSNCGQSTLDRHCNLTADVKELCGPTIVSFLWWHSRIFVYGKSCSATRCAASTF